VHLEARRQTLFRTPAGGLQSSPNSQAAHPMGWSENVSKQVDESRKSSYARVTSVSLLVIPRLHEEAYMRHT